jgi:hypothetical protein
VYVTDSSGNVRAYLEGYPGAPSYINNGNFGIGTTTPITLLQVAGPITAGSTDSTLGIDYLYGRYGSGKLFTLGSQYSSGSSFMGFAVKAKSGSVGYLSSTAVTLGRSAIETGNGYVAFLTGSSQTSTDGGTVSLDEKARIDSSGNLGIGTQSPSNKLEVIGGRTLIGDGSNSGWLFAGSSGGLTAFHIGSKTNVPLAFFANSSGPRLTIATDGNVGIGTTNPTQKLCVTGTVRAQEVIVDTGWSDYVFDEGYKLKALSETEAFVKAEKHLPGIPSAKEVSDHGISVGEMQAKLLAKIEELTLHQIAQGKELSQLKSENRDLRSRVIELEAALKP